MVLGIAARLPANLASGLRNRCATLAPLLVLCHVDHVDMRNRHRLPGIVEKCGDLPNAERLLSNRSADFHICYEARHISSLARLPPSPPRQIPPPARCAGWRDAARADLVAQLAGVVCTPFR